MGDNESIYDHVVGAPDMGLRLNLPSRHRTVGVGPPNAYNRILGPSGEIPRITLPPKRFEDPQEPKFDSIRHLPWFAQLMARRAKISSIRNAYSYMAQHNCTQLFAAQQYGVDERELRDFIEWVIWSSPIHQDWDKRWDSTDKVFRDIITEAYKMYCESLGYKPFRSCISRTCPSWGAKERRVIERWEVDPRFYPNGYKGNQQA